MNDIHVAQEAAAKSDEVFLAPGVKLEPLVDNWYAWPHLLAPAQQALNLAFRYIPLARSFVVNPRVHAAAAADPALFGGPFLELPASAVGEVRAYLNDIERDCVAALEFAQAFREFTTRLQGADGFSLDCFRREMPDILRGRIEIAYDLSDNAGARVLEEMFDEDDLGLSARQAVRLHRQRDAERAFFLSTPRLSRRGDTIVRAPFNAPAIAALCGSRSDPVNLRELSDALGTTQDLSDYFTSCPPAAPARPSGDNVRVRYFGHACVLIETERSSILVDPTCAWDAAPDGEYFSFDDFPTKIDVLVISHGHQDHLCPETLLQLRSRVKRVVVPPSAPGALADPSVKRMLRRLGFRDIVTLDPLEELRFPDGTLTALPFSGEHSDLNIAGKQCLLLSMQGRRIGLFIDTDAIDIDVYRRLADRLRGLDVMFLGMECNGAPLSWLYGPLLASTPSRRNDNSRRLSGADFERAAALMLAIEPKRVCVYAMGQEPWMRYLMGLQYEEDSIQLSESDKFIKVCLESNIPAERLFMKKELIL